MRFPLARIPSGGHLDIPDVSVEPVCAPVEGAHELVHRVEGELGRAAKGEAHHVPLVHAERRAARQNYVPVSAKSNG